MRRQRILSDDGLASGTSMVADITALSPVNL